MQKLGKVVSPKIWSILTIVILISLHLKIAQLGDFGIALAFLLIPLWVYLTFDIKLGMIKKKELCLLLFILFLPFIPGHIYNWSEFFKTYAQYAISYFLVIRVIDKPIKYKIEQLSKALSFFQVILLCTVLFQFISVVLLKQYQFYNLFGRFQLYYELSFVETNLRMKGFYLEPSYLGFITINVFWIKQQINSKKSINSNLIFTILILLFAKSAFAFIALFVLLVFDLYFIKKQRIPKFITYVWIPIIIYVFHSNLFSLFRLNELSLDSTGVTSGYMRLILPFLILTKIMITDGHLLGLTFGQLDAYITQFDVNGYQESGINNSFFAIIGYWGITAIIGYMIAIIYFFKTKNMIIRSFMILTFLNLNNSGAFVPTQFVFVAFLLPFMAIKIINTKSILIQSTNENYNNNSNS